VEAVFSLGKSAFFLVENKIFQMELLSNKIEYALKKQKKVV